MSRPLDLPPTSTSPNGLRSSSCRRFDSIHNMTVSDDGGEEDGSGADDMTVGHGETIPRIQP